MRSSGLLLGAFGCIVASGSCQFFGPTFEARAEEEMTVQIGTASKLRCKTHNGKVTVHGGGAADTLHVKVVKVGRGTSQDMADASLAAIELFHAVESGEVEIGWKWRTKKQSGWGAAVSFAIEGPSRLAANIETHNGGIELAGLDSDVQATTHNGGIRADVRSNKLELRSHNGHIRFSGAASAVTAVTHNGGIGGTLDTDGPIEASFESHNGAIRLDLGDACMAAVEASTNNGGISTSGLEVLEKGRRSLSARTRGAADDAHRIRVKTHNGGITLEQRK